MAKPNLQLLRGTLKVRNADLTRDVERTFITNPSVVGATTATVQNIAGAAVNGWAFLGSPGDEQTELIQIHSSTAPTGSTITWATALLFPHPTDCPIFFLNYNKIEFSRATTSGGSKTVLSSVTLTPDQEFTLYTDTANATGYAYARFNNTTTSTFSDYSDEQIYPALLYNQIGTIINRFYSKVNEKNESFVSRAEALDWIWDFIDNINDLKTKWRHEEADQDSSQSTVIGGETFTLPSTIKYTNEKSIIDVRMEGYTSLNFISAREWVDKVASQARSSLSVLCNAADTTLNLVNSSNFAASGDGYINGDAFSWTGNASNQLTGCTGLLAHSVGEVVFQNDALSQPLKYTVLNGTGKLFPAPSSDFNAQTLIIDFYARLTHPDSENDLLPLPYVSPCMSFLQMSYHDKRGDQGITAAAHFEARWVKQATQIMKNERMATGQHFGTRE